MRTRAPALGVLIAVTLIPAACDDPAATADLAPEPSIAARFSPEPAGPPDLAPAVFDIAALPDGSLVLAENNMIREIDRKGGVHDVLMVPTEPGSPVNGIAPIGRRSMWVASGGLDLAVGAGLWRVSNGRARLVGDIHMYETVYDPDANAGVQWKDPRCEDDVDQGFSAGPQSNPYHLIALSGGDALVADAAGNSVLLGSPGGSLELVAVLEPPTDGNGDWHVLKTLPDQTECYVQPVATSVAEAPDGDWYVGELTGAPAVPGWSRVWRIEGGSRDVSCPSSDECELAISGLTSVIDLEFGPDGRLYVVEFDVNGWLEGAILENPGGGTILACDVVGAPSMTRAQCELVADGLVLPGAVTFDKWDTLWVLEAGLFAPSVHPVD